MTLSRRWFLFGLSAALVGSQIAPAAAETAAPEAPLVPQQLAQTTQNPNGNPPTTSPSARAASSGCWSGGR